MSTVILDTITGKSTATTITIGSTPVVSASANSMTIRGEGTAQTSIQQGLLKVWFYKESDGASYGDSFNTSSLTDTGTGDFTVVFNNNLANAKFGAGTVSTIAHDSQASSGGVQGVDFNSGFSRFKTYQNGGISDVIVNGNFAGDLA